jgi:tRNA A-37 threonylcarbamoyl transferase component Bud32
MALFTTCPNCGCKLKVPGDAAGRKIKCPKCSTAISVLPTPVGSPSGPQATGVSTNSSGAPESRPTPADERCAKPPVTRTDVRPDTDRNLLFGALALQAALIDNDQFAETCAAWTTRKSTPLAELLVERGLLTPEEKQEIERLVQRHLKRHAGDVRASLAAVVGEAARRSLADVADPEVQRSLSGLPARGGRDPGGTIAHVPAGRSRYTPTRLHAKGGIGQVWLARDVDLRRDVALKELQEDRAEDRASMQRFLAEAQITGQLEHPGIVPVYELVAQSPGGRPFYTMRFVRGRTLTKAARAYHKKRVKGTAGSLELRALLNAFVGVCNAVAYAHSRGVIHRDLKGANVVLGDFGEAVVLDWGLAKLREEPEKEGELPPVVLDEPGKREATLQGQVLGTPGYMAPEQAEGRLDLIDEGTDVYGLGAVLYEVLTGDPPFSGPDTHEVLRQVREEEPPSPRLLVPGTPVPLEAVCLKGLAKRRGDRYASAAELAADIQCWLADEPVSACREALPRRLARWGRRHPTLLTATALVLLATAAVGFWLKHERDARAANTAREEGLVLASLQEATQQLRLANLGGARAAIDRAQDHLTGSSGDLRQRVRRAQADLDMVAKLENVLLLESFTAGKFENVPANANYTTAFLEYGLDVSRLSPQEAAERIKASAIRDQLVTALDDWIFVKPQADARGREQLLAIARLADADGWRQQLRDPATHGDRAALEQLARRPEVGSQPPSILVHLGKYLAQAGAWTAAVEVLQQAQHRHAGDFWINYALAMSLTEQEVPRTAEALGFFRAALAIRPQSRIAELGVARQLLEQRQTAEALAHFRKADELAGRGDPSSVQLLVVLGTTHMQRGKFASALAHLQAAQELLLPNDQRRQPLAEAVRVAEQMVALEAKVPALLRGEVRPASPAEGILLAQICQSPVKRLYATAARLYLEAFADQPALAEDEQNHHRYNAACTAVLAGTGQGEEAAKLETRARAAWRKHALEWLRADVARWTKACQAPQPQAGAAARGMLQHARTDPDLAGVRGDAALAPLPDEERVGFQRLWAEVNAALGKGASGANPDQ